MVLLLVATVVIVIKSLLAEEAANLSGPFAEDAKLGEWITVPRRPTITYDLDNNPLEIETDTRRGGTIDLKFFWDTGSYSFQISYITENSPYVYLVVSSSTFVVQKFTFVEPVHTWKIAKTSEEFKITCDETTVGLSFGNAAETLKKPVTHIAFDIGDRASTRYKDTSGQWVDNPRVLLDYNINLYPLQFTTSKAKENKEQTHVTLYTADMDYNKKADIHWDHDDYQFWVDQCNRCNFSQSYATGVFDFTNVPDAGIGEKTWEIEISATQLTISCNEVEVYTFVFSEYTDKCPGCTAQMNMNFVKLQFNELNDKAAVSYLGPPPCTALPVSWMKVEVDPPLPAPYYTPLTVRCDTGYTLTSGDNTVTCLGEEKYEFMFQPVCRKNRNDDDDENDGTESDRKYQYLWLGLGSGIAVGLIVALIIVSIRMIAVKPATRRSENAINASYKVAKDSTVINSKLAL